MKSKGTEDIILHPIHIPPIIELILDYVSASDIIALKRTSSIFAFYAIAHEKNFYKHLPENSKATFGRLSDPLKSIVWKRMFDHNNLNQLKELFSMLQNQGLARSKLPENVKVTNGAIISITFNILRAQNLQGKSKFDNDYAIYGLDKQLFKTNDIVFRPHHKSSDHCPQLAKILSSTGIKVLEQGQISLEEIHDLLALDIIDLSSEFLDEEIEFLRKKLIHPKLLIEMNKRSQKATISSITEKPRIINLLESKLVTFSNLDSKKHEDLNLANSIFNKLDMLSEPAWRDLLSKGLIAVNDLVKLYRLESKHVSFLYEILVESLIPVNEISNIEGITYLLCPLGIATLREGLITWKQAKEFRYNDFSPLITEGGLKCLREGFLSLKDALDIFNIRFLNQNLSYLLSEPGLTAFINNVITIEDAKKYDLKVISIPGATTALKEKLITLEQISKFPFYKNSFSYNPPQSFSALFTELGLQALRENLINPEQAAQYYDSKSENGNQDNLSILLNPIGMMALRKKLISADKACYLPGLFNLLREDNPDIITAMELGLISPSDFQNGGKYTWLGISPFQTKKLISDHLKSQLNLSEGNLKNIVSIQSMCRSSYAKNKFTLFQRIDGLFKSESVSIKNIREVNEAINLAEQGKLTEASDKIAGCH